MPSPSPQVCTKICLPLRSLARLALPPLQLRLRRSTLPCDEGLASAAARFFARIIRLAGGASVSEELLAAAAAFTFDHARLLDCQVGAEPLGAAFAAALLHSNQPPLLHAVRPPLPQALAALHTLLLTARWQPSAPVAFGNRVVERLLRLEDRTKAAKAAVGAGGGASGGLKLRHLSDVVGAGCRPRDRLGSAALAYQCGRSCSHKHY